MTEWNQWTSAEELLDFAIQREEEAARFYRELAGQSTSPDMRDVFESFAREEDGHKAKLERVKAGGMLAPADKPVQDLKIADYVVEQEPDGELTYQQALLLAMQKEKAAFRFYADVAARVDEADLRTLLEGLAQEEAKHKLRFEIEYDEVILRDN